MNYVEIKIPQKGSFYLVNKDFQDEFIGDPTVIEYYQTLFLNAVKNKLTYTWNDHATVRREKITQDMLFNCDVIAAVLKHNNIPLPDDLPSDFEWFRKCSEMNGIEVIT